MRGSRGYGGRDIRKVVHFPETSKPVPIVPKRLIRGVSERVDCFGEVVVQLNESEAEARDPRAARRGRAGDRDLLPVVVPQSRRTSSGSRRLVQKIAPDVFVTCSVDIAPKWGEYERVTATALNAYLGPVMGGYLERLDRSAERASAIATACRSPSAAAARCRSRARARRRC